MFEGVQSTALPVRPVPRGSLTQLPFGTAPGLLVYLDEETSVTQANVKAGETALGFVLEGPCQVRAGHRVYPLFRDQAFCILGPCVIVGGAAAVVIAADHSGFPIIAGPIENNARCRRQDWALETPLFSWTRHNYQTYSAVHETIDACNLLPITDLDPDIAFGVVAHGCGFAFNSMEDRSADVRLERDVVWIPNSGVQAGFRTDSAPGFVGQSDVIGKNLDQVIFRFRPELF